MRAHILNQDGDIINTILVDSIDDTQIDADVYGGGIGQWWNGSAVVIKPRDVEKETAEQATNVRSTRDTLIAKTDWTQCADISAAVKAQWVPYRKALRDVPQQAGFPFNVIWPT